MAETPKLSFLCVLALATATFFSASTVSAADSRENEERKPLRKILLLGGNGMMGSATATALVQQLWADVSILNRGNWYWDSEELVKPLLNKHFKCDRRLPLTKCHSLMRELQMEGYHAVVDFSTYDPATLQAALTALKGKTKLYIYISTDSVYEVCATKNHTGATQETDAIRPTDPRDRELLSKSDNYGERKLQGEEVLRNARQNGGGPPYVIFRLPDVVGPRDNTLRWWYYQIWIEFHKELGVPVTLPESVSAQALSVVYSLDVAKAVIAAVQGGEQVHDEVFNLAVDAQLSLATMLKDIQKELSVDNVEYKTSDKQKVRLYPTVSRGPVDITKAKERLLWTPTPWQQILRENVEFYKEARQKFVSQLHQALQMLVDEQLTNNSYQARSYFFEEVKKRYNIVEDNFMKEEL